MAREKQGKKDKVLQGIELVLERMGQQHKMVITKLDGHDKKLDEHGKKLDGYEKRFDRLEMTVLEVSADVKTIKAKQEVTDKKIEIVATNHESRIRRLEKKAGV